MSQIYQSSHHKSNEHFEEITMLLGRGATADLDEIICSSSDRLDIYKNTCPTRSKYASADKENMKTLYDFSLAA